MERWGELRREYFVRGLPSRSWCDGLGCRGTRSGWRVAVRSAAVLLRARPGAPVLVPPASSALGSRAENALLPCAVAELERLQIRLQEVALDGGFDRQASCLRR